MLPHSLCEYTKHPNEVIRHSSEFVRYYAEILRTQLNNQITKEHYKEMAKIMERRGIPCGLMKEKMYLMQVLKIFLFITFFHFFCFIIDI